ncbi:hypothetical protein [Pseudomonas sp.]|uniref:hypothetical protein n=1 Tax=Pseudomonas sp. TaxID=306 RepID=UPI00257A1899|nr:hypothetical protein [Pseudomonas sp.]
MSWLDGMVDENEALSQNQRLDTTEEQLAPGFFTGSLDVIGPNLKRGALEGGAAIESGFTTLWSGALEGIAGALLPEPKNGGTADVTSAERSSQETLGQGIGEVVQELRPDPASVGMAGQLLGEAAAVLPRTAIAAMMGGPVAGAVAAGAPAGYSGKQVGMAEGLDESTATLKGVIDATTVGVGAVLPAARFVKPVLGDLTIAVGANMALGAGGRGLTGQLLEGGGYSAQAEQYKAMDAQALAVDAVLGAAFFGIGRASMRKPTTETISAALTENNAQHFEVGTAPGVPTSPRSAVAHQDSLRAAVAQLNRGEPVTLPDAIHSAEFMRSGDELTPIAPARDEVLASARMDVEPLIRAEIEQQAAGVVPNVKDLKTELATLQRSVDGLDATFKDRAKAFQEQGQSRKKAEASAKQAIADERDQLTQRQASINDSLNTNRSAEQARADLAALDRGETPKVLEDRINKRADEVTKGFERKPLADGVVEANRQSISHIARQEISRILDELDKINPRPEPAPVGTIADVNAAEPGKHAAEPAKAAPKPQENAPTAANDASTPGKDSAPGGDVADADPTIQVANEIMGRVDDIQLPTGAIDADGNPVTVSARQLLAEADADIKRAQDDSLGFAAAAACALQRGV